MKQYDYIVVGAGIAGCATAYFLQQAGKNVLIVDRLDTTSKNASSTAGGFLSPLLGKPNSFKTLVTQALNFSIDFYKQEFPQFLINKGVVRIPKDEEDAKKFESYLPYMDFEYELKEGGCFFPIGSQVFTYNLCQELIKKCDKKFNYEIQHINYSENQYTLNDEFTASNIVLTTGADVSLIEEKYFNIRPVWGQRIDVETSSCIDVNYHKECSLSTSVKIDNSSMNKVSIGATHHRFNEESIEQKECLRNPSSENFLRLSCDENSIKNNTETLIQRANNIHWLKDVKLLDVKIGARASSVDYFPMVGSLINSKETLNMFPYIKNGTHVPHERFSRYNNLFVLNGLGGRGFVLAPYLAKELVNHMVNNSTLSEEITCERLFIRWAKRQS